MPPSKFSSHRQSSVEKVTSTKLLVKLGRERLRESAALFQL